MRLYWERQGKNKIIKTYNGKLRQLVGTYIKMELTYWECSRRGNKRKRTENQVRWRMTVIDDIKKGNLYDIID